MPIGAVKLLKYFLYNSFPWEKQCLNIFLNLFKTFICLAIHLFPTCMCRISVGVSNANLSVSRKSPCFSLCPAFPVSFYHPAVWPILHPPNHPLPPPPWTGSPEGICAVCLCRRLGASRWTGETCYQTEGSSSPVTVWQLFRKHGIKVLSPPKNN